MLLLLPWLLSQELLISIHAWSTSINSIFPFKGSYPLVQRDPLTVSVLSGAQLALEHCQKQFKWDRWNCPETAFLRESRQPLNRESAYVLAVMSAGVVHSVTRNCSRGDLEGCGCNTNLKGREVDPTGKDKAWIWGGCSDDVNYGERVAQHYLDSLIQGSDINAHVSHHNINVGRQAVRTSLRKRCKCHGLSGTCSIQTCWLQAAPFTEISAKLRQHYDHASKLASVNSAVSTDVKHISEFNAGKLVYTAESPNYCVVNNTTGWMGTHGRTCSKGFALNASDGEHRSCKTLCRSCGYRVRRKRRQVKWHCNCKFRWCCEVTCDTCSRTIEDYYCD